MNKGMKRKNIFVLLVMFVMGLVLFTACSSDNDENDESGSQVGTTNQSKLNISGQSTMDEFNYAYYHFYDEKNTTSKNEVWCIMEFLTFDYLSYYKNKSITVPSTMSVVTIEVLAGETIPSELPTGDFFLEHMHCILNASTTSVLEYSDSWVDFCNYHTSGTHFEDDRSYEGNVSIKKSGSKYTVTATNLKLVYENDHNGSSYSTSFTFSGSIPHAQDMDY